MNAGTWSATDPADFLLAAKTLIDTRGPHSWTNQDQSALNELLDAAERSYVESLEAERGCVAAVAAAEAAGSPLNPALQAAIADMRERNASTAAKLTPLLGRPVPGHVN